jgi:hypothetical protein
LADLELPGESVGFEARDAEETPPVMGDEVHLLRLGLRAPFFGQGGEELVGILLRLGRVDGVTAGEGVRGAIGG